MKVFFCGLPSRFQKCRTMRTMVSLASEPEEAKKTRSRPAGVISASFSASSIEDGVADWKKVL